MLFVLDEIATGFGRLGSMIQYEEQKSIPDIVTYGKMMTGGYLTMAATLTNKKIYDSYCNVSLIAISIDVEPLSEKKTLYICGDILTRFSASLSAGSFVRLNMEECCNFLL